MVVVAIIGVAVNPTISPIHWVCACPYEIQLMPVKHSTSEDI